MHTVDLVHSTPDGDNLISYMARVSNPSNQMQREGKALELKGEKNAKEQRKIKTNKRVNNRSERR